MLLRRTQRWAGSGVEAISVDSPKIVSLIDPVRAIQRHSAVPSQAPNCLHDGLTTGVGGWLGGGEICTDMEGDVGWRILIWA